MKLKAALFIWIQFYCLNVFSGNETVIDSLAKIKYENPSGCIKRCKELLADPSIKNKYQLFSLAADAFWHIGQLDSALRYYNSSLVNAKVEQSPKHVGLALSNIGYIRMEQAHYNEALDYFLKATEIFKSIKDSTEINITLTYIGQVYYYVEKYDEGIKIYTPLAKHYEKARDYYNACISYEMMGHMYRDMHEGERAEENYLLALKFAELSKNNKRLAQVKFNYADFLIDLKKFEKGEFIMLQAIEDLKRISAFKDIAVAYMQMGDLYHRLKQYSKAKDYLFKAIEIASEADRSYTLLECYESLAQLYEDEGDFKEALMYHKKFKMLTDSVRKAATNKELLDVAEKYETDKKEQENQLLQTQNQLSHETIKQQKTFSYFIIIGLVLTAGLAFFIFRGLKIQRQANVIITQQKNEVEEHRKEILDSIQYAKRIQNTLLAHHDFLDEHLPNNFVLFKPKDIVSGDFYWATLVGSKHTAQGSGYKSTTIDRQLFYLAVCDSTGHGVPGAFMSLLNIGFLNEAINEKNILEPNKVLDYVRQRLTNSVSKEGQKDGFDGILLCIEMPFLESDTEQEPDEDKVLKISYAAAHNAPVLVSNKELIELPKDKMPVGVGERQEGFALHTINLKKSDTLYLYTDGYADQFGGPKGKKFKYKALNDLLISNSGLPLNQQLIALEQAFLNWKGDLEQVDDVCVVGIKF